MMSLGWSSQAISLTNRVLTRKSLNSLGRVNTRSENFFYLPPHLFLTALQQIN